VQVILPDGQINHLICHSPVQPLREKYFASRLTQITFKTPAIPSHSEGRFAIVTDVGCGMRWTRQRQARANASRTNDADAYGEVVWFWRPDAGVKFAGFSANDGGKKARSPGRARSKPLKPLRRESWAFR
jgi:hypothetical protein